MDRPDDREFQKGDRVKSVFGPVMTVEEVYAPVFYYRYRCVWTDAAGNPQHELFRARDLTPVDPPPTREQPSD